MRRVVSGVLRLDDRFLVTRRNFKRDFGGMWEFPGGSVEEGETDDQAIVREFREELGIEVKPTVKLATTVVKSERFHPEDVEIHTYRVMYMGTGDLKPSLCEGQLGLMWLTLGELQVTFLTPGSVEAWKALTLLRGQ